MNEKSLDGLKTAFDSWRSRKRHPREAIPGALLARARRAARHHGSAAVARATKVDRKRLRTNRRARARPQATAEPPRFSRVELRAPPVAAGAYAELETATGVRIRFFAQTDEVLGLFSLLCSSGGDR
jgi:hypothetical protein